MTIDKAVSESQGCIAALLFMRQTVVKRSIFIRVFPSFLMHRNICVVGTTAMTKKFDTFFA